MSIGLTLLELLLNINVFFCRGCVLSKEEEEEGVFGTGSGERVPKFALLTNVFSASLNLLDEYSWPLLLRPEASEVGGAEGCVGGREWCVGGCIRKSSGIVS